MSVVESPARGRLEASGEASSLGIPARRHERSPGSLYRYLGLLEASGVLVDPSQEPLEAPGDPLASWPFSGTSARSAFAQVVPDRFVHGFIGGKRPEPLADLPAFAATLDCLDPEMVL